MSKSSTIHTFVLELGIGLGGLDLGLGLDNLGDLSWKLEYTEVLFNFLGDQMYQREKNQKQHKNIALTSHATSGNSLECQYILRLDEQFRSWLCFWGKSGLRFKNNIQERKLLGPVHLPAFLCTLLLFSTFSDVTTRHIMGACPLSRLHFPSVILHSRSQEMSLLTTCQCQKQQH